MHCEASSRARHRRQGPSKAGKRSCSARVTFLRSISNKGNPSRVRRLFPRVRGLEAPPIPLPCRFVRGPQNPHALTKSAPQSWKEHTSTRHTLPESPHSRRRSEPTICGAALRETEQPWVQEAASSTWPSSSKRTPTSARRSNKSSRRMSESTRSPGKERRDAS